jgi:hypothetical protein
MSHGRGFLNVSDLSLTFRSARSISSEPPGAARVRAAETLLKFPADRSPTNITFHNGWIASGVPVELLFWGSWWKSDPEGSSRMAELVDAVQRLLNSCYLWELDQYRAAPATYRGALVVEKPPPPANFVYTDATDLVWELIDDAKFPEPEEDGGRIAYFVVLPRDTKHEEAHSGAHAYAIHENWLDNDDPAWYAWIGYDELDGMTNSFSHELVELITDPELDGWLIDNVDRDASEIGDLCESSLGWVNGVFVSGYWSMRDQKCVIPTEGRVVRIDGRILAGVPRQVASGPYQPPAPTGLKELLPSCHLDGKTYSWTLSEVDETAELDASAQFFTVPAFEWTVAGVKLSPPSGRVEVNVVVTRSAAGGSTTTSESISLAYATHDSHLELSNDSVAGNMDIPVSVIAYDQGGATRPENAARASVIVSFQGSILTIPGLDKDIRRCEQAVDELWKEMHKNVKHGPIGPLGEENREFLAALPGWISPAQFQRLKMALVQAEAIGAIDEAAGEALREVLLEGLQLGAGRR